MDIAYLNGEYLPLNEAKIAVTDYGFLFGFGLFETFRAYNGKLFRLEEHLARLTKSAVALGIPLELKNIREVIIETIRRNRLPDARVRITVTKGAGSLSPDPGSCRNPVVLITSSSYIPYSHEIYANGFKVIFSPVRRNSQSQLTGMKVTCFLESMLARQKAGASGADDALMLNELGMLAEATSSNVFLVNRQILQTPRLGSGILPGVTRRIILELAAKQGLNYTETDIRKDDLMAAEEVFLTNSMIEIMPVTVVDNRNIGSGRPGNVTQGLMDSYKQLVIREAR